MTVDEQAAVAADAAAEPGPGGDSDPAAAAGLPTRAAAVAGVGRGGAEGDGALSGMGGRVVPGGAAAHAPGQARGVAEAAETSESLLLTGARLSELLDALDFFAL